MGTRPQHYALGRELRGSPQHLPHMISSPLELSIVIPAFNEERRLPETLRKVREYLNCRSIRAEVLVIDDGSTDTTAKTVEHFKCDFPELHLISNHTNRGKGFSVRQGMLEARGDIAVFTDADLSTPIEELDNLIKVLRGGRFDGVIGSRAVNRSLIEAHQSRLREVAGIIFNFAVRRIVGLSFQDTQCGFKAFRLEKARCIFRQQRTFGFGFDPEILFLAQQNGLHIAEVPVRWAHNPATKVHVVADSIRMFRDLFSIRWNDLLGRYELQ